MTVSERSPAHALSAVFLLVAIPMFLAQAAVGTVFAVFEQSVGVPPQVVLVWLALPVVLASSDSWQWLLAGKGRLPIGLGLVTLLIVVATLPGPLDLEAFRKLMQVATGIALYLVTFQVCQIELYRRRLLLTLIVVASASALLAVSEFALGFRVMWSGYVGLSRGVPVGLEYSPVPLAYAIVVPATAATVAILSKAQSRYLRPRWLIWLMAIVGILGLAASASRSGTIGVVVGAGFGALLLGRNRNHTLVLLAGAVAAIVLVVLVLTSGFLQAFWKGGVQQDARLGATIISYLPIILTNPFGVSPEADLFVELQRAEEILGVSVPMRLAIEGLDIAPHHFLLTASLYYGWTALFSIVAIYAHSFWLAFRAIRVTAAGGDEGILVVGLLSGMTALLIHSSFHNASILQGEMRNWFTLALLNSTAIAVIFNRNTSPLRPLPSRLSLAEEPPGWPSA